MKHLLTIVFVAMWMGCAANVGVENKTIPTDSAQTCEAQCQRIGLSMTAVALMADNVGCICQRPRAAAPGDNAAATSAGMATIMLQQQEQQRQQQSQTQTQPQQ